MSAEKEKEEKSVKEAQKERKEPEKTKESSSGSSTNPIVVGVIVAFFVIALGFYTYYFHGGGREFLKKKYGQEVVTPDKATLEKNLQEALKLAKEKKGKHTFMSVASRLEFYRKTMQKKSREDIYVLDWRVEPSPGKEEKDRFYDVFHDWKVNGKKVTYVWLVDLKTKEVAPSSNYAKKLEEFDKAIYETIPGRDTAEATPTGSPTPKSSSKPGDEGLKLRPLIKGDNAVNITPPTGEELESAEDIQATPGAPDSSDLPAIPVAGGRFKLRGFMTMGGAKKAIILDGSSFKEAQAGTSLSDGWRVSRVGSETVTITNGAFTRTLKVTTGQTSQVEPIIPRRYPSGGYRASGSYPKAGEYRGGNYPKAGEYSQGDYPRAGESGGGSYPKAGEYGGSGDYPKAEPPVGAQPGGLTPGKPSISGPPVISEPGSDAPPVPPAPGGGGKETGIPHPGKDGPTDQPTIIPLD